MTNEKAALEIIRVVQRYGFEPVYCDMEAIEDTICARGEHVNISICTQASPGRETRRTYPPGRL